jgi:glycosyltransferase involved in cell wall biosynthesis
MAEVVPTRLVTFADRASRERIGRLEVIALGHPWHVRGQRQNPIHPGLIRQVAWATTVHCHQRYILTSTLTAGLCRLTGRRVFVTDHGGGGWDPFRRLALDPFHGWLHQSEYAKRINGHEQTANASVIYGGVDLERFSPDPTVAAEPLVVFVGRLLPHKGVNDLVEALPEGLTLELIGRPYDERFLADLKRLAVGKRVLFRHDCDDAEVVRAYRRARCVVLPSTYRSMYGDETLVPELLGQTLLEGMACGTAALCTAVGSMPEVVEDSVTGFVVPPNDPIALGKKLEYLRDHPDTARKMGAAARARVTRLFSWEKVVERCLEEYGLPTSELDR